MRFIGVLLCASLLVSCGPSGTNDHDGSTPPSDATAKDGGSGRDGSLDDGGGSDGMIGCYPETFVLQQAPPAEVYLVVDRSGSMLEPGSSPGLTRWDELKAAVDAALSQYDGAIKFGILTFPANSECNTSGPQVGLALRNGAPILSHLNSSVPAGGTPTAAALNNAAHSMLALGDPESPKFLILATDGGPNCNYFLSADPSCSCTHATSEACCTNNPGMCLFGQSCLDDQGALAAIRSWRDDHGIDTFVIGLDGTSDYVNLLNAMATAGGRPQQGGSTDYYSAGNQTELLAALQTIAVGIISCEIQLDATPEFPDYVRVYMDSLEVPRDPANQDGWNYTDSSLTTIRLFGPPCEALQDGAQHSLTATFACVID